MPASRLRVGIAGAGHFGRYHALKAAASDRVRLVGVHDPDTERAKTVGWEAGAPDMAFAALLAGIDALIVAAPAVCVGEANSLKRFSFSSASNFNCS